MKNTSVTVAVVAPQEPVDFFDLFWEGVWSAAYDLAPLDVRVRTLSSSQADAGEQSRLLDDLLAERVHSIVLMPAHVSRLNASIEKHTMQGTPVVTVLADAPQSRRVAFVGPDSRQSGRLAGEMLIKMLRGPCHIGAFPGPEGMLHLRQRFQGFRETIDASRFAVGVTEFQDIEIFADACSGRHVFFDAVYIGCPELIDLSRLLGRMRPDLPCVAFQQTDAVEDLLARGVVSVVIDESRYHQGYIAVQKAYECALQKAGESDWVRIPSTVVFASHLGRDREGESLQSTFEMLVRERTGQLRTYKEALETANSKLLRLAETDSLTSLLNRRKFEEVLEEALIQTTEQTPTSVLAIDVDYFKSLNDLLGHPIGDQALRAIAATIQSTCRTTDSAARIGGDEFVVVLPETSHEAACALRDRIRESIAAIRLPGHPELRLSASFGVATAPQHGSSAAEVVAAADAALYEVKRNRPTPRARKLHVIA